MFRWFVTLSFLLLIFTACKKDEISKEQNLSEASKWMLDSMKVYYYWNEEIAQNPDPSGDNQNFFKKLLSSKDRFSYLIDPQAPNQNFTSFAYYGFEYVLLKNSESQNGTVGIITLVVPGSPASKSLKRGDFFTSVNNVPVNGQNTDAIKKQINQPNGITLQKANLQNNAYVNTTKVEVFNSPFNEQPVYLTKTFNNNGKKAGYLFYNFFDQRYDTRLLDSLKKLGNSNITDLILDLRYNLGGDVSSAAKLAVAITPVTANQTFVKYQANKNGGQIISSFSKTIEETNSAPFTFNDILKKPLSGTLYVLTSAGTASAAELLIHNLKPYFKIIQIGQKTLGKDMASFAIDDQRTPQQINLTMHPLIFKLYDTNGEGDYSNGLIPDFEIDEFSTLPLKAFGDANDPLLAKALQLSLNTVSASAKAKPVILFNSNKNRALFEKPVIKKISRSDGGLRQLFRGNNNKGLIKPD